ncbi:hypothetical protein Hamer_G027499, partial [Homarus americanus]
ESGEDEDKEESRIIPAKDLKDAFFCWSKLSKLAEDYHPDVGSVQKAISVFNDDNPWPPGDTPHILKPDLLEDTYTDLTSPDPLGATHTHTHALQP